MKRKPKRKPKIGDLVTCKVRREAFYSGYAGNPECWFEPGMVGVVGNVDSPFVRGTEALGVCVDFDGPMKFPEKNGNRWRCKLRRENLKSL